MCPSARRLEARRWDLEGACSFGGENGFTDNCWRTLPDTGPDTCFFGVGRLREAVGSTSQRAAAVGRRHPRWLGETKGPSKMRLPVFVLVAAIVTGLSGCAEPRSAAPDMGVAPARPEAGPEAGGPKDVPAAPDVPGSSPGGDDANPPVVVTDTACPAGFHTCGNACVDDLSVATCGASCQACPSIAGGEATCDGIRCGVKCPAGKKVCASSASCIGVDEACDGSCPAGKNACNGVCVAATDKGACGAACTVCPTSPAGTASCDGTQCSLACNAGHHLCGSECKPDNSPASCGTSCTPCKPAEGGGAACVNGACQATCPAGLTLCRSNGKCQAAGVACDGTCPAGKHECGGNCVDTADVNSCGTSCTPCPTPANADATCDGKACGFKCRAGFHLCGDQCKPDTSTASCGTQCTPCPAPANGSATCAAGTCGLRCNDGFHLCNGQCRSDSDADACGAMCTKCEAPAGGRALCAGGRCDFECMTGRRCNNQCVAMDVPCGNTCATGWTLCNGKCYAAGGLPAETCANGVDDNCNGAVDCKDAACGDGTSCGAGKVCKASNCVVPCTPMPGTCTANPGASKCIRGKWICNASGNNQCVDDGTTSACGAGQLCQSGSCVGVCTTTGGACSTNPGASTCIRGRLRCNTTTNTEECINDGTTSKCTGAEKCTNGTCVPCGGLGQPCCASNVCSATDSECKDGRCVLPGSSPGCSLDIHCATTRCNSGYCTPLCGGFQQQCCNAQLAGFSCRTEFGLTCRNDTCLCGRSGLPCCNPGGTGAYCSDGNSAPTACPANKICP